MNIIKSTVVPVLSLNKPPRSSNRRGAVINDILSETYNPEQAF